jgi:hypothetical protein
MYSDKNEIELTGKEFFEQFMNWADENKIQYETTALKLGVKLSLLKIPGIRKGRHTKRGETKYYNIPELRKQYLNNDNPFDTDEEDDTHTYRTSSIKKKISLLDIL